MSRSFLTLFILLMTLTATVRPALPSSRAAGVVLERDRWPTSRLTRGDLTAKAALPRPFPASSTAAQAAARPVVMVHGFSSSWEAWATYLGPEGYLAGAGIPGYAVGDGQFPGSMNTGSIASPMGRTNTIAENAAILGEYIAALRHATGAQKIDLLAHSMGGLISRYYIDRIMPEGEVAQLIMLGSPMAGTECANLPASLGFYFPAVLEIQPVYVRGIFNPQITHRKGAVFHALAGIPIQEAVQSPCTQVPTDLAVSLESVGSIPLNLTQMPVLHTDLNVSEQVFQGYVLPLLQTPTGDFQIPEPDPPSPALAGEMLQFTRMYTGHLHPGETSDLVIQIDPGISLASFALCDSSRSMEVVVRGASGNELPLDVQTNGMVKVEDPSTLLYLGYGFKDPKPGAWQITLQTTAKTPAAGADYALTAIFTGGAELQVQTGTLLPELNEPVALTASLSLGGQLLPADSAEIVARAPDGRQETFTLPASAGRIEGEWTPRQAGLHFLQIQVAGRAPDDVAIERTAFLVIEAQPAPGLPVRTILLIGAGCLGASGFILAAGLLLWMRRSRKATRVGQDAR